jgi:hypothetical protein
MEMATLTTAVGTAASLEMAATMAMLAAPILAPPAIRAPAITAMAGTRGILAG